MSTRATRGDELGDSIRKLIGGALIFLTSRGLATDDITEAMRIDNLQRVIIGSAAGLVASTNMTVGLTINQGGADNEILALKSSDVI